MKIRSAAALLLLTVLLSTFLSSCGMFDEAASLIGLDTYDYMAEEITAPVEKDSEIWKTLEKMLPMLTVNSARLAEFDGSAEAHRLCADSLLNYMLDTSFEKYAGNKKMLDAVLELYPGESIIAVIPKDEYETAMYTYFGGSVKISHGDTELFRYLEDAEVYVPAVGPIESGITAEITDADETEHSYRVIFTASDGDNIMNYFALIIKREDGTLYFKALIQE